MVEKNQSSICLLEDKGGDKMKRVMRELPGLIVIVCILIGVCVTQVLAFVKMKTTLKI